MDASTSPADMWTVVTNALIVGSLEVVWARPMCWELDRLKDANLDSRALGVENQCREAEARTPARGYQPSIDVTLQPAALESGELMIIWATWCQRSVGG
jgi:hypothetical protein